MLSLREYMRSLRRNLVLLIILLITSSVLAQSKQGTPKVVSKLDTKTFSRTYETVNALLSARDWKGLNQYIHPRYGFYILDNPGVRPQPFCFTRIDSLANSSSEHYSVLAVKLKELKVNRKNKLVDSSLPYWDCATEKWNKKGNYCKSLQSYPVLAEHMLYSCNENPQHPDVQKAAQFGNYIKKHVIQTSGYEMCFAFIDGKWYIAVINLCDKCSA